MLWFLLVGILLFALGLAIGSFLNVVIYRTIHGDSALRGRSYCDTCKKPIAWYDNIPLLSFLVLRGKCRQCKEPISWQYPIVEFITAALFLWWYGVGFTFFQLTSAPFSIIQPLFWLCVGVLFLIIFFADLTYYLIPDSAVLLLTTFALSYRIALTLQGVMLRSDFWLSLFSGVGASLFFLALYLLTKGKGMGFGDVKLAFPLGLLLGWPQIVVGIFLSFIIGSFVGIGLIILSKKSVKSVIPFGPFLILGTLVALVWGDRLLSGYLTFL